MTDERIEQIRARLEAATPGPWEWWKYGLRQGEHGPYIIRDAEEGVREGMGLFPLTVGRPRKLTPPIENQ